MDNREPLPGMAPAAEGGQEKAMTVRSVLLNRDSPDVESRLKRRRNRTQQVRFKDLVEGGTEPAAAPGPHTPRASPPPRLGPAPAAPRASRRSWPQAQPGALTLPMPRKACVSAAIQTSPSLHKPFPATQPRSSSACDVTGDAASPAVASSARCPGEAVRVGTGHAAPPRAPGSLPARDGAAAIAPHAATGRVPPPPRDPCPPYPGRATCPAARCPSPVRSCAPEPCPPPTACTRLRGNAGSGRGAAPRPASVPCAQSWLPTEPRISRSDSERSLPRRHPQPSPSIPAAAPCRPAQGTPLRDPPAPQPWGGPCCALPAPVPPAPCWHGSAAAVPDEPAAALGHLDPHGVGAEQRSAQPGHGRAPSGTQPAAPEPPRHGQPCLSTQQPETLRHVQDLLQLVVVTKGPLGPPPGDQDARTSQGARPRERGDLRSQLQSLEGVLETSQQTIRVLLDVIQDLEKKEAQRDGRHSYRTGQDIANCGTCRDCACIIYSVEHDFRQQEGRFQRVLSHITGDATPGSPTAAAALPPRQEPSPVTKLPAKLDAKKSRRKCFWFL
ncbi:INSYN2B protein-like [Phaenicophaeus curvirostris]|uniref:INSYN2B protein-like n=1 Tax=Phaenicophaeus curvirostris TaxID=33595 RepID=UPI0037F09B25